MFHHNVLYIIALHCISPQWTTLFFNPLQYTVFWPPALHCLSQYCYISTVVHHSALQCTSANYTAVYFTTLPYTVFHQTELNYTSPHCTELSFTTLPYTVFHHTALQCISPHCTVLSTGMTSSEAAGLVSHRAATVGGQGPRARGGQGGPGGPCVLTTY